MFKTQHLPKLQNSSQSANRLIGPRPQDSLPDGPRTGSRPLQERGAGSKPPPPQDAGLADGGSLAQGTKVFTETARPAFSDIPALGDLAQHLTTHYLTGLCQH